MGKLHGFRVEVKYKPLIKLMPADYADAIFVGMININAAITKDFK
jgi:hypothetical protein